jgi:hypothetical protein
MRLRSMAAGAIALLVAVFAGSALANTVTYSGRVSGHPREPVAFELIGPHCPNGADCFKHATVTKFGVGNYRYPGCPNLLEGAFEYGNPNTLKPGRVRVDTHKGFGVTNGRSDLDFIIHGSFHGRFLDHGSKAKGWVEVDNGGCLTGKLNWTLTPER